MSEPTFVEQLESLLKEAGVKDPKSKTNALGLKKIEHFRPDILSEEDFVREFFPNEQMGGMVVYRSLLQMKTETQKNMQDTAETFYLQQHPKNILLFSPKAGREAIPYTPRALRGTHTPTTTTNTPASALSPTASSPYTPPSPLTPPTPSQIHTNARLDLATRKGQRHMEWLEKQWELGCGRYGKSQNLSRVVWWVKREAGYRSDFMVGIMEGRRDVVTPGKDGLDEYGFGVVGSYGWHSTYNRVCVNGTYVFDKPPQNAETGKVHSTGYGGYDVDTTVLGTQGNRRGFNRFPDIVCITLDFKAERVSITLPDERCFHIPNLPVNNGEVYKLHTNVWNNSPVRVLKFMWEKDV